MSLHEDNDYGQSQGVNVKVDENILNKANGSVPPAQDIPSGFNYLQEIMNPLMSDTSIAADLQAIKEKAEEYIKVKGADVKVTILDRNNIPGLSYSVFVFYKIYAERNLVKFYTVIYTKTGRVANTAQQTVNIALLHAQDRNRTRRPKDLYTYSDALDEEMKKIIANHLKQTDRTIAAKPFDFLSLNGLILRYNVPIENVVAQFTFSAFNAFVVSDQSENNRGLNLPMLRDSLGRNCNFIYNLQTIPQGVVSDKFGNPIKADFMATISLKDNNNDTVFSPNSQSMDVDLVTVYGYVTAIPVDVENVERKMNSQGVVTPSLIAIAPNIVLTLIDSKIPDVSSSLLGLIAATQVADDKQFVKVIMDTMTPDRNPGLTNLFTRDVIDAKGNILPVDVTDKKLAPNDKALLIDSLFTHSPLITLDATAFYQGYDTLAPFVYATDKKPAVEALVKAASILTNGAFRGYDFPIVYSMNVIPAGSWRGKDSERDIRDLELEALLHQTNGADETAMNYFIGSISINNPDAYNNKIELLANFIPDADIEGKTMRMMIAPDFILALTKALQDAKISFQFDNKFIMPSTGYNIGMLRGYSRYGLSLGSTGRLIYSSTPSIGRMDYNAYGMPYNQVY